MIARPSVVVVLLALGGAALLLPISSALPRWPFAPAALGAACVFVASVVLLRELRSKDRWGMSAIASFLGFLVASAAASATSTPWPVGFAAAWLPAYLFFMGGVGRERLSFELSRLEEESDDPTKRPRVIARATAIRQDAASAARALDPEGKQGPRHPGDARAIYAYAAQVVGYAQAKDGNFREAIASIGEVPAAWMPVAMRGLMLSNLAFYRLCAGDVAGAKAAIEQAIEKEAPAGARPILRATRAAVLIHEGDPSGALELVGKKEGEAGEPEALRGRYAVVRAIALAAMGDVAAARGELERTAAEEGGVREMERWVPAAGAAAGEMKEMLARKADSKSRNSGIDSAVVAGGDLDSSR